MSKERNKEPVGRILDSDRRFRWAILFSLTILFCLILFPSLVTTKHQYNLGDVAERDIKSPRDFFIEDQAATEINRQLAEEKVLTVYDYDDDLGRQIALNVEEIFARMRTATAAHDITSDPTPVAAENSTEETADTQNPAEAVTPDKRKYIEEKLGIRVTRGAFSALETVGFSEKTADLINQILLRILNNGVVTNKEILLKESEKGITLRNVSTKKEEEIYQLKKFYGLDQAKTMVRIVGQPLLNDLDYGLLNLVVDFVQRLIQPNITLNRNETQERKKLATTEIKTVLHKIKAG